MFNNGDRVTGVPAEPEMLKEYPTVTGYYENVPTDFMGEVKEMEFVVVGDVYVSCDGIQAASRRDTDTEFPDE